MVFLFCRQLSDFRSLKSDSHVGQSYLRADGEGLPVQVHLHLCGRPKPVPLRERDGRDRLRPTGQGAPMVTHRGEVPSTSGPLPPLGSHLVYFFLTLFDMTINSQ